MPLPSEVPPEQPWATWWPAKAAQLSGEAGQGQHILFMGPTQSGKTVLCRIMARISTYVVVFGTKPFDKSLDAYVSEGYVRIDHWPPTPADYRKGRRVWQGDEIRFILWPKIKKREDLRRFAPVYKTALDHIFMDGGWTVIVDEGLWFCSRGGFNLGTELADASYGVASNKVSLYTCLQRPRGVPPIVWSSVSWVELFHLGNTDDVREMASLGTYTPRDAIQAVQSLRGHRFLDLPCRGGAEWSVSEVDMGAI